MEAVQYVSKHSKGQIAVVEDEEQLQKFLKVKSDLPDLKGNKNDNNGKPHSFLINYNSDK